MGGKMQHNRHAADREHQPVMQKATDCPQIGFEPGVEEQ